MRAFGNLTNRMMEGAETAEPFVGMGATECLWSDRHAYTVIRIKSKCRLIVQRDNAIRTDGNEMSDSQSYRYEPDPEGYTVELIKTKHGWKQLGGGSYFTLGVRDEYFDYSF